MDTRLRTYLAELFGTFLLVLFGAGAVCSTYLPHAETRFLSVGDATLIAALAEGIALAIAVSATCSVSVGCCNPAITLALFVTRRLDGGRTFLLIAVQLVGAFLAGLTLRGLFTADVLVDARMGAPHLKALLDPSGEITLTSIALGVGVEFLLTFFLTIAAFATLLDKRALRMGGFGLGVAQIAVVLLGYRLTGGAANPARWFGPAVWQLSLSMPQVARPLGDHPVYWVGPTFGALAGSIFYIVVVAPADKK